MKNGSAMEALRRHAAKPASKAHGVKKFSNGGKTNANMKHGRNIAKIMAQRGR